MYERPYRSLSDEELGAALDAAEKAHYLWRQQKRVFKSDAHAAVDRSCDNASVRLGAILKDNIYGLAHSGGMDIIPTGVGDLLALTSPKIREAWHAAIDADTRVGQNAGAVFNPLDRPAFEEVASQRAALVTAYEREQRLRALERRRADAEAELAEAE